MRYEHRCIQRGSEFCFAMLVSQSWTVPVEFQVGGSDAAQAKLSRSSVSTAFSFAPHRTETPTIKAEESESESRNRRGRSAIGLSSSFGARKRRRHRRGRPEYLLQESKPHDERFVCLFERGSEVLRSSAFVHQDRFADGVADQPKREWNSKG